MYMNLCLLLSHTIRYDPVVEHYPYISNSVFTNTWCISKCYQGPNITPLTSMLNKLGYIELYISKTRIYRSFSEVPLPFKSMLITFHISNSSKSLESSQFRDQHTDRNQLTLLSFLTHIYHSYIEHFEHNESN